MKYRQKVTVDAAKWTGENLDEMRELIGEGIDLKITPIKGQLIVRIDPESLVVEIGDYLVLKEACGDDEDAIEVEVFTVRGAVFEASYEAAA